MAPFIGFNSASAIPIPGDKKQRTPVHGLPTVGEGCYCFSSCVGC
jgi:hypothetical protein